MLAVEMRKTKWTLRRIVYAQLKEQAALITELEDGSKTLGKY
jgi:hypothetical protein